MIISDRRIYFIYAFCLYVSVLPWQKPGAHCRRGETVRMPVFSCIRDFAYASVFLHQLPHAVATATGASALRLQMLTSTYQENGAQQDTQDISWIPWVQWPAGFHDHLMKCLR